jgi:hypothetical protein
MQFSNGISNLKFKLRAHGHNNILQFHIFEGRLPLLSRDKVNSRPRLH